MRWGMWGVLALFVGCGSSGAGASGDGGAPEGEAPDGAAPEAGAPGCIAAGAGAAVCGAASCGNGQRDTCSYGSGPAVTEECDGADMGGASCASLGYFGGTLACSASCALDTSGCTACATGPQIGACANANVDARDAGAIALATTATEIVVAWASCTAGVRIARFKPDATLIAERDVDTTPALSVAIAAVTSGFVVAYGTADGVHVQAVDASLGAHGASRTIAGGADPILVARGTGGPLLAWAQDKRDPDGTGAKVMASVLGEDGAQASAPVVAFPSTIEAWQGSGAFVGGGFLLAQRAWTGQVATSGVAVVAIGTDGALGASQTPVPTQTEFPQLAWTGSDARLVYNDFGQLHGIAWTRLDATGASLGAPVLLSGDMSGTYSRAPNVAIGSDSVVFLGVRGATEAWGLDLVRLSATGAPVGSPAGVAHDEPAAYAIATLGADVAVAWLGTRYPRRLGVAVIHP